MGKTKMTKATAHERYMLDLINAERDKAGRDPLTLELNLNQSAEAHSEWMLDADVFSHSGQGGSNAGDRMEDAGFDFSKGWSWGENLALRSERGDPGIRDDVEALHQNLMNSSGHRANILSTNFDYVGIGIETGRYKGYDVVIVTQNFARTGGDVDLDLGGGSESAQKQPKPAPAPAENTAPILDVADVTATNIAGERWQKLKHSVDVSEADGDTLVFYEIRDRSGADNVLHKGEGRVDASGGGYRFDADDLGEIRLVHDKKMGDQTLSLRAYDGEDWSDWTDFTLTTVAPDDWIA